MSKRRNGWKIILKYDLGRCLKVNSIFLDGQILWMAYGEYYDQLVIVSQI